MRVWTTWHCCLHLRGHNANSLKMKVICGFVPTYLTYLTLLSTSQGSQWKFFEYENKMRFHTYLFDLCDDWSHSTYNVQVVLLYLVLQWTMHCLNKRERSLHSERNSILRDESNIKLKCPALFMAGYFALYKILVPDLIGQVTFEFGFFLSCFNLFN